MRLLRLFLLFILILTLTACGQLSVSRWLSYIDGEITEEESQEGNDIEDITDEQENEKDNIDEDQGIEPGPKDVLAGETPDDEILDDEVYRDDAEDLQDEDGDGGIDKGIYNEIDEEEQEEGGLALIKTFETRLPETIAMGLKYDKYPIGYDYLLILKGANIRELPSIEGKVVRKIGAMERIALVAEVKGDYLKEWDGDSWYQVEWEEKGDLRSGFIFSSLAEPRGFQFDKMVEAIEKLEGMASLGSLAHISNYKNKNGVPPKINGKTMDSFGYRRSQSAAGYEEPNKSSDFRYIPDGMLVHVKERENGFSKVKVVGFEEEYWVLDKYVNTKSTLTKLNKIIIVDRKNQNQGIFELVDGQWTLVSYGLSTTGKNGTYSLVTPLGFYMAIEKRDKFLYFRDGTTEIAGYAPYAVRFSGGGYIHGVPVEYKIEEGKKVDPGMAEYLHSIGTIPRSHMCVRNYTSQAKFIHSWVDIGETAFIVIE